MEFRTKPFPHQLEAFRSTSDIPRYALFWEMGVGKTKPTIDTAAKQYLAGEIDTLLIIAPDGVERNWINDEVPTHLPSAARKNCQKDFFQTSKSGTKRHIRRMKDLLEHKGFVIFAMSYSAVLTKRGKPLLYDFLKRRKCFYVLDEATHIANPGAKRAKTIHASAKYAPWRRVLTGTPIRNGPFDAYSIMKFLDLGFWRKHELDSFSMFKYHFGKFIQQRLGNDRTFPMCVGYQKLEELNEILATVSSRLTKDEVLDLPPKLYTKRYFEITQEQRKVYDDIKRDYIAFIEGEMVNAPLAITRLIRFQQIVSGYIPVESDDENPDPIVEIPGDNPRIKVMADLAKEIPHSCIVWAKFTRDVDKLIELLGPKNCARYDGKVSQDDREKGKNAFQNGDVPWFVAKPQAAGEGLTLTRAKTVVYYNMTYKLVERLQSEDRAHRIGQEHPVTYVDIVAKDTVDEHIVEALVKKRDLATIILGDDFKAWI